MFSFEKNVFNDEDIVLSGVREYLQNMLDAPAFDNRPAIEIMAPLDSHLKELRAKFKTASKTNNRFKL